jgi:site-specific DNA recombinase
VNRLAAEKTRHRAEDEGRLEAVGRKIASIIRAIEDGMYQPSMKQRMAELETEKAVLQERLAAAPEPPKIRLHPNLPGLYRERWRSWTRRWPTRRSRPRPRRSSAARSSGSR